MTTKKKKNGKKGVKQGITPKNLKFIENYIESGNATQSYIEAGYSSNGARVSSYKLLTNTNIQKAIEKRRLNIANKNDVTAAKIINELAKIAFLKSSDVFSYAESTIEIDGVEIGKSVAYLKPHNELSDEALSSIASIKETNTGLEIKLYDKQKALDTLSRYVGLSNEAEILKARAIKEGDKSTEIIINTAPATIIIEGVDPDQVPE